VAGEGVGASGGLDFPRTENSVGRKNYGISRASAFFPAHTRGSQTPVFVVPSD